MMPPNMLKRPVPAIPIAPMDLDGAIRGLATQPVSPIVAHADLVADPLLDLHVRHGIHFDGGFTDQLAQHLALGGEFDEGELDGLVVGEGLAWNRGLVDVFQ